VLLSAVERLQPPDRELAAGSPEWRPYLLLHGRYVEGLNLQALQDRLALSDRQLRREHGRALRAIATLLWDQAFPGAGQEDVPASPGPGADAPQAFEVTRRSLEIAETVRAVIQTLQNRAQSEGTALRASFRQPSPRPWPTG